MRRQVKVHCPHCGRPVPIWAFNGNTIDIPLICAACGQSFAPRYYCPDRKATNRHAFEVHNLYVDSLGEVYTFCPEHTFTTYDLVETEPDRSGRVRSWVAAVRASLSVMLFRLALVLEGARQRLPTQESGGQQEPSHSKPSAKP